MSLAHSFAKGLKTEGDTEGALVTNDFDGVRGRILGTHCMLYRGLYVVSVAFVLKIKGQNIKPDAFTEKQLQTARRL